MHEYFHKNFSEREVILLNFQRENTWGIMGWQCWSKTQMAVNYINMININIQ